jgi:hypothetical protein
MHIVIPISTVALVWVGELKVSSNMQPMMPAELAAQE